MNTPIDYSSWYSFGHFCCRVKQGKRLSEFLQKYTNTGTETIHLAGRLIYTKLSSHQSFVINMYVVRWHDAVFLHGVSIDRSKEDEKWTFLDVSADFRAFLVKATKKKEENLNWTLVNTENLRAEIAACQRQYYVYNPVVTIAICTTRAKIITKWRFWTTQYPCSTENGTGISSQSISKI